MVAKHLLECIGLDLGTFRLPGFEVRERELIGVVELRDCGEDWNATMQELAANSSSVSLRGTADVLSPFPSCLHVVGSQKDTVSALLSNAGLYGEKVDQAVRELGIALDRPQRCLQLTERLLLGLAMARLKRLALVVLSTGGLDPIGVSRVLAEADRQREAFSSINFFHHDHLPLHRSLGLYDKLIHVEDTEHRL
jgi:hypothetical protein